MASNLRPPPAAYLTPEWVDLRDAIVRRDGHRCRNCGLPDALEVHHWLPLPDHQDAVDGRGYGTGENPLLVHESGLITLCKECHGALTAVRTERAILRNPELKKLGSCPTQAMHNVFELWALAGKVTPFKVVKETWNTVTRQFYLVERVEIGKWPFGSAWGRYCRGEEIGELQKIKNAGIYDWLPFEDALERAEGRAR